MSIINKHPFKDVLILNSDVHADDRGCFLEGFRKDFLEENNIPPLVQQNISLSKKDVFRGLHYQLAPAAQGKLIRCVRGRLLDVMVDIRKRSDTFKQHGMIELNSLWKSVYIPPGYAHGFKALEDNTVLEYHTTDYYNKDLERCINVMDPDLDIFIPGDMIRSDKDKESPFLDRTDIF